MSGPNDDSLTASDLDEVVIIQSSVETTNAAGRRVQEWTNTGQTWAHIEPTGSVEKYREGAERVSTLYRVTVHRQPLSEGQRLLWGETVLNIRSAAKAPAHHQFMTVIAEAGVNT